MPSTEQVDANLFNGLSLEGEEYLIELLARLQARIERQQELCNKHNEAHEKK